MKILEQTKRKPKKSPSDGGKSKRKPKESPSDGNIPKPQDQPTDDGIPKPASGGDIKIQLMDTRTRLYVQSPEFVSAIQKALNKGNDYSSNNIFK
jgi:hypothetical protein